jgi:RHS repeat-associated protein
VAQFTTLKVGAKNFNYANGYDDRGNVTNNGTRNFIFNRANQLTNSGSNYYVYDGYNRRVKTVDSKGTSYSFYSQAGKLLYSNVDGEGVNYIFLGDKLIAKEGMMPVNTASSQQHYRPFGETIEAPKDDVGYTGHKFDTDLGLSYMQQRYFNPVTGRFLSNDPIGIRSEHSFNRYAYANNNPFRYVDPDGQFPRRVVTNPLKKPPPAVPPGSRPGASGHSRRDSNDRGSPRTDRQGNPIVKNESADPGADKGKPIKSEHAKQRNEEGKTDRLRQVGDRNKTIANGKNHIDTETGNTVHVDGDRVVITDGNGKKVTSFKNPKKNRRKRIDDQRWVPKSELNN